MNIHLVLAHPETGSFNAALHNVAVEVLRNKGFNTFTSGLYRQQFNTVISHADFRTYAPKFFRVSDAQKWAEQNNAFAKDIFIEQEKL